MTKTVRRHSGSEIYLGHEICPAESGSGVVVQPYMAPFSSSSEARRWIDQHVAEETTRVQRGLRSPLQANPAALSALQHIAQNQTERHAGLARCGGKTSCGCAPARCGCSKPRPGSGPAYNRAGSYVNPLLGWRGGPSRSAVGVEAEMSVNGAKMWELAATSLYGNADRIVCAVREMLQNGRDAPPGPNKRKRDGVRREVRITLSRQSDTSPAGYPRWTLTCQDNGAGMDCIHHPPDARHLGRWVSGVLPNKFLDLASSGKGEGNEEPGEKKSIGGFGMAKAIILGVSSTWRFEILTQDNIVTAKNLMAHYEKLPAPVEGTTIRVFDIEQSEEERRAYGTSPEDRVARVLSWSSLEEVDVWFNGRRIEQQFPRSLGRRTKPFNANLEGSWGPGVESATVTSFKRDASLGDGAFYVQMDGLYQFSRPLEAPYDIVVDMIPAVGARDERYPMPMSRDNFKWNSDPDRVLRQIARTFIKDGLSAAMEPDYTTTLPSGDRDDATITRLAGFFGSDLGTMSSIIADMHAVAAGALKNDNALSEVKNIDEYQGEGAAATQELGSPLQQIQKVIREDAMEVASPEDEQEVGEDSAAPERGTVSFEGNASQAVGTGIQTLLEAAGLDTGTMDWEARSAYRDLQDGYTPTMDGLVSLVEFVGTLPLSIVKAGASGQTTAVVTQVEAAVATSTVLQGLTQLGSTGGWGSTISGNTARIKRAVAKVDPFRDLCAMKVHKDFPKKLLRQFKRSPKKYLKVLAAWDATLRLISATLQIFPAFRIGFIFENDVRGAQEYEREDGWEYLYINPLFAVNAVKVRKRDPRALAYYFYGLACHELAHVKWHSHDEQFVSSREDIGFAAAHVLRPLETLLRRVFNIGQQRAPRAGGSAAQDLDFSRLNAELTQARKSTMEWKKAAEATQTEVDQERLRARRFERETEAEREARQTFERLWKESTTGVEAVAGNLWAMTGLRGYEDWILGPGAAFLPPGVDAARFVEALRKHPGGAVKYLLGEGALAARDVALAQAGVPVVRDPAVIEGMKAEMTRGADLSMDFGTDDGPPAVDLALWPRNANSVEADFDDLPEHVQHMIERAIEDSGSRAYPTDYTWRLSQNEPWLDDIVKSRAFLAPHEPHPRPWAPIVLLTSGPGEHVDSILGGWATINELRKLNQRQQPPVYVIRGWDTEGREGAGDEELLEALREDEELEGSLRADEDLLETLHEDEDLLTALRDGEGPSTSRRGPSITEVKLLERARASHNGQVHVTTGLDRGTSGLAKGRHYGDRELTALRQLIQRGELVHVKDMDDRVAHGSQHTWVARLPTAADKAGTGERWYHLTDRPAFKLDPKYQPEDNAVAIEDRSGQAGIYLAKDVEAWVNGHNYWRPFVVEFDVDPSVTSDPDISGRWGGEMFVPASSFPKLRVLRVIPLDAYAREVYEDYGWVEEREGRTFDTMEPLPPRRTAAPLRGYHYDGPDVRDMPPEQIAEHKRRLRAFVKDRRG